MVQEKGQELGKRIYNRCGHWHFRWRRGRFLGREAKWLTTKGVGAAPVGKGVGETAGTGAAPVGKGVGAMSGPKTGATTEAKTG